MYTSACGLGNRCPFHLSLSLSYGSYTLLPPVVCVEYNSQIMSSSVMFSHWSVCIDLQATLPLCLSLPYTRMHAHTHTLTDTQPRSAPGTKRRLHLVSQTTKSVRGCLALLLYSVINGSEHPQPRFLCMCMCMCVFVCACV